VRTTLAALFLLSGAIAPSLAMATELDGPEARLAWSMGFGGEAKASDYALTLSYHGPEAGAPAMHLAEWQVLDRVGVAKVAGLPVLGYDYRTNQMDDPLAYGNSPMAWAWWVVSGVIVTAVVLDQVDSDDEPVSGTGSGS